MECNELTDGPIDASKSMELLDDKQEFNPYDPSQFRYPHVVWSACRFIRSNPGCNKKQLKAHLSRVYPHGAVGKFDWVLRIGGSLGQADDTLFYPGRATECGLFLWNPTRIGDHRRGFYILRRGSELADEAEPSHVWDKPKLLKAAWVVDDCELGMLLTSRSKKTGYFMFRGGSAVGTPSVGYLKPGEIITLVDVKVSGFNSDADNLRKYGRPYPISEVTVMHPHLGICSIHAEYIKPLFGKRKKKGGNNANQ